MNIQRIYLEGTGYNWQKETPKISTFKIATLADKECVMWIGNNANNLFLFKKNQQTNKKQAYHDLVIYFADSGIVPEEKQKNLHN